RGRLHRPYSQRRKARRPSHASADQVRIGHQPQDREGARPANSRQAARACRRGDRVRRREFIALIGGAAAWPRAVRAQQGERRRRVGVLMPYEESSAVAQVQLSAFRDALAGLGWSASRNLTFDYRWTGSSNDLVRSYAKELVALAPDLILAASIQLVGAL